MMMSMVKKLMGGLALLLIVLSLMTSNSVSSTSTNISSCPLDLTHVQTLPWNTSGCQNISQPNLFTRQFCCPTIVNLFELSLAKRLKETSIFFLPNISTVYSCFNEFQNKLNSLSLLPNLSSLCLRSPISWVIHPKTCAGIQTEQDWINKLGPVTRLDSYCKPDLTDLSTCDACLNAVLKINAQLVLLDGNISSSGNCLAFTLIYAAGAVNKLGPYSPGSASCIFWLPIVSSLGSKGRSKGALFYSLISAALAIAFISCFLGLYILWERTRKKKKDSRVRSVDSVDLLDLTVSKLSPGSFGFSIKELKRATDEFSEKNLIGQGGFGVVYKGKLGDGTVIAVKKIKETDIQGDTEFCKEIEIISNLKHRNLVPLIGCCVAVKNLSLDEEEQEEEEQEKQIYIVYAYMPNKSLYDHLFFNKNPLNWPQRKSIILDVAKGLAYLHYGVKPAIYHRDIKATNILLDSDMRARIADFGLAKQGKEGRSHTTTIVAGTHGYLAPEYALYGQLTEKSDVYSFGVLVLEVMSGRKALNLPSSSHSSAGPPSEAFLITDWAWELVKSGHVEEILDPALLKNDGCSSNPRGCMERFILVGILCAHVMVAFRPNILDALKMLEGDIEVPPIPSRPLILNKHFSP